MSDSSSTSILRDQQRAAFAYRVVGAVDRSKRDDYRIAVNNFGANIMRMGLAGAVAAVERTAERGELLLSHLAQAQIAGLRETTARTLPGEIRSLTVDSYILATRELLHVATWLKRAVQATF